MVRDRVGDRVSGRVTDRVRFRVRRRILQAIYCYGVNCITPHEDYHIILYITIQRLFRPGVANFPKQPYLFSRAKLKKNYYYRERQSRPKQKPFSFNKPN